MKQKIEPGDLLKAYKGGNQKGTTQMMHSMKRKAATPIEADDDMVMKRSKKQKASKVSKKKSAVKCKSCGKVACKGSHAKKA